MSRASRERMMTGRSAPRLTEEPGGPGLTANQDRAARRRESLVPLPVTVRMGDLRAVLRRVSTRNMTEGEEQALRRLRKVAGLR